LENVGFFSLATKRVLFIEKLLQIKLPQNNNHFDPVQIKLGWMSPLSD